MFYFLGSGLEPHPPSPSDGMPQDVPQSALAAIETHLLSAGQPFELEESEVCGQTLQVFKHRPRTLRDVLARSAAFGAAPYMVWADGRRYSFEDHLELVGALAERLQREFGIRPGQRVAILAANCPEWVLSFWAITSLGAVAVGLNAWWTADEILYGVGDCDPSEVTLRAHGPGARFDPDEAVGATPVFSVHACGEEILRGTGTR